MNDFPWLTVLIVVPLVGALVDGVPAHRARAAQAGRARLRRADAASASSSRRQYDAGARHAVHRDPRLDRARSASTTRSASTASACCWCCSPSLLVPIVLLASWHDGRRRAQRRRVLRLGAGARGPRRSAVFAATDVFLFYVVFEATLIPAYFLIGGFGRAEPRPRRAEVPDATSSAAAWCMLASVIGLYVVSADAGSPVVPLSTTCSSSTSSTEREPLAVRRLLHRLRGQGAAVPGAHLAGRHHREGDARHQRAAGLRARQDRHLRHAALLPRAVPGGLASGRRRWSWCWR